MDKNQSPIIHKVDFDGKDIFEIGIGYGSFALEHLLHAKSIFGIDTSQAAIEDLQSNWPGSQGVGQIHFQEGNIVDISLVGKEFDIVVFSNSF